MEWRAYWRLAVAVAMDDADHDMGRRRAVGEGVSGGWEGADG